MVANSGPSEGVGRQRCAMRPAEQPQARPTVTANARPCAFASSPPSPKAQTTGPPKRRADALRPRRPNCPLHLTVSFRRGESLDRTRSAIAAREQGGPRAEADARCQGIGGAIATATLSCACTGLPDRARRSKFHLVAMGHLIAAGQDLGWGVVCTAAGPEDHA